MFRQSHPGLPFSIEEGTAAVPSDGRYYVLEQGEVRSAYASLRHARRAYEALKTEHEASTVEPAADETGGHE